MFSDGRFVAPFGSSVRFFSKALKILMLVSPLSLGAEFDNRLRSSSKLLEHPLVVVYLEKDVVILEKIIFLRGRRRRRGRFLNDNAAVSVSVSVRVPGAVSVGMDVSVAVDCRLVGTRLFFFRFR